MTKDKLLDIIHGYKRNEISWDSVLTAVEAYSSASNNGKPLVSGSLPSDDVPLMIWANVYNPIKTDSWDLHHTEASAVKNSIGAKTHCYVHESLLGNDR